MKKLKLSYLKPHEARRYSYYSIPKLLIDHPAFDGIDYGAKLLYGLMLNRAGLSAEHAEDFTDDQGRLYIIYTIDQVREDLRCSKPTAVKLLDQLSEIGLIEKKRRGQGKPTLVYVKDFSSIGAQPERAPTTAAEGTVPQDSRSKKALLPEVKNIDFLKSIAFTSRSQGSLPPEVNGFDSSYLDLSDIDRRDPPSFPPGMEADGGKEPQGLPALEEEVKKQIEYSILAEDRGKDQAAEVVRLMVDVLCRAGPEIKIGQNQLPAEAVRKRFRELEFEHVVHALDKLSEAMKTGPVRNVNAYLLTLLYNAPASMNTEISAQYKANTGGIGYGT